MIGRPSVKAGPYKNRRSAVAAAFWFNKTLARERVRGFRFKVTKDGVRVKCVRLTKAPAS